MTEINTVAVISRMPGKTSLPSRPCRIITNPAGRVESSTRREFHLIGARTRKALALIKDSWISLELGITSKFLSDEHNALLGACQER